MTTPSFRLHIAQSLDGFIARSNGSTDFLRPFDEVDYGFSQFCKQIGTIVMGRKAYDIASSLGGPWFEGPSSTIVITSTPLGNPPPTVARVGADIARLVTALRKSGGKDVWIMGGAMTANAFLNAGAIDRIDLFVVPVLLGDGIPLFTPGRPEAALKFAGSQTFDKGLARLSYIRA
jgi:dihydrofolate reductase